jgi:hypothetical protein
MAILSSSPLQRYRIENMIQAEEGNRTAVVDCAAERERGYLQELHIHPPQAPSPWPHRTSILNQSLHTTAEDLAMITAKKKVPVLNISEGKNLLFLSAKVKPFPDNGRIPVPKLHSK